MRIIMKIQIHPESESELESDSGSDVEDSVPISSLINHIDAELTAFEPVFEKIEDHLKAVEKKVNGASIDSFYPATHAIEDWCKEKALAAPFSLEQWFQAVLTDVLSSDLQSRTLNFGDKKIPWGSKCMTVFEILQVVPIHLKHVGTGHRYTV
jgi:hypothetical protein